MIGGHTISTFDSESQTRSKIFEYKSMVQPGGIDPMTATPWTLSMAKCSSRDKSIELTSPGRTLPALILFDVMNICLLKYHRQVNVYVIY